MVDVLDALKAANSHEPMPTTACRLPPARPWPPNEKRFSDRIETDSVDSVFSWLNRSGLGAPARVIR